MKRFDISNLDLNELAELLLQGSVMIYPTDTIAGIGCIGTNQKSVEKVYKIKGRNPEKPVSYAFSSVRQIEKYAEISPITRKLFSLFPGPISLILPLKKDAPKLFGLDGKSIGVRIPKGEWLISLIEIVDRPIVTTSSNYTNQLPANTVHELDKKILDQIDVLILWDGRLSGLASTVISVMKDVKLVREGAVTFSKIIELASR